MPREFNLTAAVTPSVDERDVEREASKTRETFETELEGLSVEVDDGIAGAGGGGAVGGASGGGGGIGGVGAAAARARGGSALAGAGAGAGAAGAAAKAAVPVAAAGAAFFAIKSGIERLAQASPALAATSSQLGTAVDLFFQPFGKALEGNARPFVEGLTKMAQKFNKIANEKGLDVALDQTIGDEETRNEFAFNLGERLGDWLRNNKGKIVDRILESYETIFLGIFSDQGMELIDALESFASGVIGVDIGRKLTQLARDIRTSWPGWSGIATRIKNSWPGWPDVKELWPGWPEIDPLDLESFVTGVDIASMLDFPGWLAPDGVGDGSSPGEDGGGGGGGGGGGSTPGTDPSESGPGEDYDYFPAFNDDIEAGNAAAISQDRADAVAESNSKIDAIDVSGDAVAITYDSGRTTEETIGGYEVPEANPGGGGGGGGGGGSDPSPGSPDIGEGGAGGVDDPRGDPDVGDGVSGLATGGAIRSGGAVQVHDGERVLPEAQVTDRGEADLAQGDQIVRLLRQIRRDLRRRDDGGGTDMSAVVDELRQLRRAMDRGGRSSGRTSEDDVVEALAALFDRAGTRNPLNR